MNAHNTSSDLFEVSIEKLVYGGAGLARHQDKVVFVPFSVPGDRLLVRAVEEKKSHLTAEAVQVLEAGKGRTLPVCPHFEKCGGCQWQQLEYRRQVEAKQKILEEMFYHRFPETRRIPVIMKACPQPLAYRSRARMQVLVSGSKSSIGFFRPRSHTIVDLPSCPLFRPLLNEALTSLRQFMFKVDTNAHIQHVDLACSEEEGAWAATNAGPFPDGGIDPLQGVETQEGALLHRRIGNFNYSVAASVFFQANDFIVPELAEVVRQSAQEAGGGTAFDLFAGVGVFSLLLAEQFAEVTAVEQSPSASRLCSANAEAGGLGNIRTVCGEVFSWMESESAAGAKPDLVLLDPPRTGATPKVMKHIRHWAPQAILYVSCDPQTLARDLAVIAPHDYTIDSIMGLDMFPQTYHFETVVRLVRNPEYKN